MAGEGMCANATSFVTVPAATRIYTLSLHDALPIYFGRIEPRKGIQELVEAFRELPGCRLRLIGGDVPYSPYGKSFRDRKSTRLNSSHVEISYAVFCLKKKTHPAFQRRASGSDARPT